MNLTAEHDFLGDGRIITTTQTTTLLLPILTPVSPSNQSYGKVLAGLAAQLGGNVSGMINAYTTFAATMVTSMGSMWASKPLSKLSPDHCLALFGGPSVFSHRFLYAQADLRRIGVGCEALRQVP
ncbi:hypothetical protein IVB28_19130 [Bradyrhizobium sp. 199]|nr:hypothetical protein [Bradyrhizobium sp. 199]